MRKSPIAFVAAHSIQIGEGVVILSTSSGGEDFEQAMSVKSLTVLQARIKAALARYARGEEHVIEGEA